MYRKKIREALCNLGREFETDELAYLALTSKVERQIRDKFAWCLHKEMERPSKQKNCFVTREFTPKNGAKKKIDCVILNKKQEPEVFIEFKAISNPATLGREWPVKALESDMKRMNSFNTTAKAEVYFILLVNLPKEKLSEDYECHIVPSHFKEINKFFEEKHDTVKEKFARIQGAWEEKLKEKYDFSYLTIPAGKFYKNSIAIHCWIVWPKK